MNYSRRGPYKTRYNHVFLIYRKLRGRWFLWEKHYPTEAQALISAAYLLEWDRAFITRDARVQVRKFYYSEPTRAELTKINDKLGIKEFYYGGRKTNKGRPTYR